MRGNRTGNQKFSAEGEIRTGKKNISSEGGGEGGNVMKMRKFPDQGSSKLLWGRAPPQGGGTSPPFPPCAHVWFISIFENLYIYGFLKIKLCDILICNITYGG